MYSPKGQGQRTIEYYHIRIYQVPCPYRKDVIIIVYIFEFEEHNAAYGIFYSGQCIAADN